MNNHTTLPQGKKEQMRQMFNRIAPSYDRLNHIMSMNIDRSWRKRGVDLVCSNKTRRILDLATGTADLAIYLAERMPEVQVVGVDISEAMLQVGAEKVAKAGLSDRVTLTEGDARALPFADASFEVVTVAFGVRNFSELPLCLQEMHRVLCDGGRVMILELSTPKNPLVRWCYELYAFRFLPWIGGLIAHDKPAYRYLPASIKAFHKPERVVDLMREAGFRAACSESKCLGIAHIYTAQK